jgi:hypothetical protein
VEGPNPLLRAKTGEITRYLKPWLVLMLSNAMNIRRLQSYFHYAYVPVRFEPIEMLGSTVHDAIVLADGDN